MTTTSGLYTQPDASQPQASINTQALVEQLMQFDGPPEQFLQLLLAAQCEIGQATNGAIFRIVSQPVPQPSAQPNNENANQLKAELIAVAPPLKPGSTAPVWLARADEALKQINADPNRANNLVIGLARDQHLVILPLTTTKGVRGAAAFLLQTADHNEIHRRRERLELTLSLLSLYEMRLTVQQKQVEMEVFAAAMGVMAAINEQTKFQPAAMAFCNEVAARWKCQRVSFGILPHPNARYIQLKGMSQTEHLSRKMQLVQDIEAAMEECLDQDIEVTFPCPAELPIVSRLHNQLATRHGPAYAISLPLRRRDGQNARCEGVLTVETAPDKPLTPRDIEGLRLTCDLAFTRLVERYERDRWVGARAAADTRKLAAAAVGPKHTWIKLIVIGVALAIGFLIFAKGPYRVDSPFVVQAERQQIIAAPFDGYIASTDVKPGDRIEATDTVLAQLETAELKLRLAAAQAEVIRFEKEAEVARRENSPVEVQIALAQADKLLAEIKLYEHQINLAEIKSPTTGIILEGELGKRIGGAVTKGDVLFSVAPIDALRAELQVTENDITDIEVGMPGQLAAAAFPGVYLDYTIQRIDPVAEVVDNQNVFRVKIEFTDPPDWLRPGMEGLAKTDIGRAHYAYIWTKDVINWVRMKLWI